MGGQLCPLSDVFKISPDINVGIQQNNNITVKFPSTFETEKAGGPHEYINDRHNNKFMGDL